MAPTPTDDDRNSPQPQNPGPGGARGTGAPMSPTDDDRNPPQPENTGSGGARGAGAPAGQTDSYRNSPQPQNPGPGDARGTGALAGPTDMPKAGWASILKQSFKQFTRDEITERAAAMTFHGVRAIFPAVLVFVSILGMLSQSKTDEVLSNIKEFAPSSVSSLLSTVIDEIQGKSSAASIAGIAGLLLALWSVSTYVSSFTKASNIIYNVAEGRPLWKTISVRLLVTLTLMIMLVASAFMVIVTGPIARQIGQVVGIGDAVVLIWDIAKWPILVILVSLMFTMLYKACPNVKQPGMRWMSLGGIIGVVLWLIASGLFALYLSFSSSYNSTYGSLAGVIIFLMWLWITNIAVLLGAEFNAESQRERAVRRGAPEDLRQFAEPRDISKLDEPEKQVAIHAARVRAQTMRPDGDD